MGEITTLTLAVPGKESLRTTVPMSVVRQFNLKPGDMLDWIFEARNSEMAISIKPIKKQAKDL